MFAALFHADWSTNQEKRWAVFALNKSEGWQVGAPFLVPSSEQLLDFLFSAGEKGPVLAGFDFPIGLPFSYGSNTGLMDFPSALLEFGAGRWGSFYSVADVPAEISLERPFYPRRSSADAKQVHLLCAHDAESIDDLRRRCERATPDRRAACSLFWTLGGNQVGKAAIAGWQEVVGPAHRRGAKLWPFDGDMKELSGIGGLTLAETYPAEAYHHIGIRFSAGQSKRRREDRASQAGSILRWAEANGVLLGPEMVDSVQCGFGEDAAGEDRFDAALGLFGMIDVAMERRPEAPKTLEVRRWEGWILGQAA
ncbi:MAG TPA: DUF429 domain-containing protein [Beijerinckiaceae bacterium]|jgi:hypothetical protein